VTATAVQIIAWGVQLIQVIGKLVAEAVSAAQAGSAPTLEDLDKRLTADQARMAQDRYAAAKNAADKALVEAAAAEFSSEIKKL
jgi:hypothetical protein